jgi:hypothetical protein
MESSDWTREHYINSGNEEIIKTDVYLILKINK